MQKLNNFPPLCMVEEGCNYFSYFVDVIREKLPTNAEERKKHECCTNNLPVKANYQLQLPTKVEKIFDVFCKHQRRFSFDFLIYAMTKAATAGMNSNCSLDVILIRPGKSATCSQFYRWTIIMQWIALSPNTKN